jgi:hypothetical protein
MIESLALQRRIWRIVGFCAGILLTGQEPAKLAPRMYGMRERRRMIDKLKRPSVLLVLIVFAFALLAGPHLWKAYHRQVMLSEPQIVTIVGLSQATIQGLGGAYPASVEISARNVGYLQPGDETTFELMFFVKPGQIGQEDIELPPVKTQCNLFAPQMKMLELPLAQRPLFESDIRAWNVGQEVPENYNPFTGEKRIGYFYMCRWIVAAPKNEGEHILAYRTTFSEPARTVRGSSGEDFVQSQTIPVQLHVAEPLLDPSKISTYLGIATAAVALLLQLSSFRASNSKKMNDAST